jgi:hypothetical protein
VCRAAESLPSSWYGSARRLYAGAGLAGLDAVEPPLHRREQLRLRGDLVCLRRNLLRTSACSRW